MTQVAGRCAPLPDGVVFLHLCDRLRGIRVDGGGARVSGGDTDSPGGERAGTARVRGRLGRDAHWGLVVGPRGRPQVWELQVKVQFRA